ncbi:hypothetical protein [Luteibacter aegosomatissinici]|uniref:hypothetical protein n=1 Tax=Luteibacter aegosomatissinici TaxID=2911539 RepID=UPI001FFBDAB8|nr:hypothetical protein [Luteibacter aegosomatissinici]UPG95881.1 hypothetical protein L2Y97_07180 [Luteibacter aegosomatissinici]
MFRQHHRRQNLSLILSALELAGISTPQAQSEAFGSIVTPRKLTRMMLGGNVPSMFARGAEHAFGLKRGWMDLPNNSLPVLPKRLVRPVYSQTFMSESLSPDQEVSGDVPA